MTSVKLSEKQKEVVEKMRDGYMIRRGIIYKKAWLYGRGESSGDRMNFGTFTSLLERKLIHTRVIDGNIYTLTDLGKSLPIK